MADEPREEASKKKKAKPRKERVLHTRIPAVLEQELKQAAKTLRIPVSNLVRVILEDALFTAQAVGKAAEEELRGAADRIVRERSKWEKGAKAAGKVVREAAAESPEEEGETRREIRETQHKPTSELSDGTRKKGQLGPAPPEVSAPLAGVLGFQPLVLAIETRCVVCDKALAPGEQAFIGVRDGPGPRVIVGPECLPGQPDG